MVDSFSSLDPAVADLIRRGMAEARAGRNEAARAAFEQAIALDPACGEALLWLAALAPDGETSLRHLSRVLEIDPRNPRAHAGIRWARKRIKPLSPGDQSPGEQPTRPMRRVSLGGDIQPSQAVAAPLRAAATPAQPISSPAPTPIARRPSPRWPWVVVAVVVICALIGGGLWLSDTLLGNSTASAALPPVALVTPTETLPPSSTPGSSATPTLVPTDTPIPTPTEAPTHTPEPSATPTEVPTNTPEPTPIPLPTETPYVLPPPTAGEGRPPPTAAIPPAGGDPSSRWIDISLSTQSVTAYEGDTPVKTFVVSTGLPGTPTVTGQFSIYMRYDSQTMSGPGYYLPGVQWVQYFYQGYALHGTYWHNNFGRPMSHGCVNMTNADALWMYQWADYGTIVNVHY